jgi:hypothetical protein
LNDLSSRRIGGNRAVFKHLRRLSFASVTLLLLAANIPSSFGQTPPRKLILTAAGARLRERPETSAPEAGRLQLGTVVDELERSTEKSKIGSAENFWHLVSAPGGARGWVFGGLVAPFEPARRDAVYLKLANDRLANASATFADQAELVRFLDRAVREVTRRDALAELELARLVALARSLASIPFEQLNGPPYKTWTDEHAKQIVYSEPAGQWFVDATRLWDLQRKYKDLPTGERAAWEAAQTPLPGECEGFLPCMLYRETETTGRYLKLYPRGAHVDAALSSLSESLGYVTEDLRGSNPVFEVAAEDRPNLRERLAELRAQLALVPAPKKAPLLAQLEEIERRFR